MTVSSHPFTLMHFMRNNIVTKFSQPLHTTRGHSFKMYYFLLQWSFLGLFSKIAKQYQCNKYPTGTKQFAVGLLNPFSFSIKRHVGDLKWAALNTSVNDLKVTFTQTSCGTTYLLLCKHVHVLMSL